jgi:hypothetical protein
MARSLSRSKVELFLQCPRCFWLDAVAGVRQPPGFPFNLNSAVDHLLKNEFDRHRGGSVVPPRLAREGLSYVPGAHPELQKWRHNFTGVRVEHGPTGLRDERITNEEPGRGCAGPRCARRNAP